MVDVDVKVEGTKRVIDRWGVGIGIDGAAKMAGRIMGRSLAIT